jgi:hypothetical protein
MIRLESIAVSREELEKLVFERCAQFGPVLRLTVHENTQLTTLARVEMASREATLEVRRHFGDLLVDETVLIRIER